MAKHDAQFATYRLNDRYTQQAGRVFLTGTQALVRIMLDQARRDQTTGLTTAGFISGYRGSPLGGVDQELWQAGQQLEHSRIKFLPAVNEDLAATAVLGAQQAPLDPACQVEGVFSMWYGKGPGLDRAGDALRHGNAYGSAPKGGVLVVAGDDHGCVSSSMPHQSDVAFMSWFMPTLNPASVAEYLTFGEYGFALSRFSGTWVGFKAISETVESGRTVDLTPARDFVQPDFTAPQGGLHIRLSDLPSPEIERRIGAKLAAVETFVQANPIDRRIYDIPNARFGIVTTGKGHLDLMEALRLLGLDEQECRRLGIDIYKVGMVWPLARRDALAFVRRKQEVLVVEEKRGIIESQFKEYFYDWPGDKPEKMVGKYRAAGQPLIPWTGELTPLMLAPIVADRLHRFFPDRNFPARARALTDKPPPILNLPGATRTPYFCSGCPHNSSTKVPKGSQAASGIGCHVMASWMDRSTSGFAQMGGEGVPWITTSAFAGQGHMFQNLGEGTWYHSGSLAIRQAVAAGVNITYKILYNDAVAMTGGQPVDGPVSVAGIAQTCRAEGIERIALVSDDISKFDRLEFPPRTSFHPREDLDALQRELRGIKGVSILIYEQTCATEKRRRRKRGTLPDPGRFAVINDLVCDGCGDCSRQSNCLSIEPKSTALGRKRQVNQSSCNRDFSCLDGFCPAFVTLDGARRRKRGAIAFDLSAKVRALPSPALPPLTEPYDLLVAGVGGTGVITIGALMTMAAHLEGSGASVLDFTGFAQKFGTVISHVRLGPTPEHLHQVRISTAGAAALIACDAVVASSPAASVHYRTGTQTILNLAEMPTGDLVLHRDADLNITKREQLIKQTVGAENLISFNANQIAETLIGNAVFANVILLGAAWQRGLLPVSEAALKQAMTLNGTAVDDNIRAFDLGRLMAEDPSALAPDLPTPDPEPADLATVLDQRTRFLASYQNPAYADRFARKIAEFRAALPNQGSDKLIEAAAKSLFHLMAYKDEYEVARLLTQTEFAENLAAEFEDGFRLTYHFAPPFLSRSKGPDDRPQKRGFGPWMTPVLRLLARMKGLRGTIFDPFGLTKDRRLDRELLQWYETLLVRLQSANSRLDQTQSLDILSAPLDIRGYGPVRRQAAQAVRARVEQRLAPL